MGFLILDFKNNYSDEFCNYKIILVDLTKLNYNTNQIPNSKDDL